MTPDPAAVADLTALRHDLHRGAERSGEEARTAERLRAELQPLAPTELVTGLGGHGVAAVIADDAPGPTVLLRADMDALPLPDTASLPYAATAPDTAHKCGHDGHMAMLVGAARLLARDRPRRGRVVLLFQPAEETGAGAAAVLADPRFAPLRPDRAFALHNLPGRPLGTVALREGAFASASRGMIVTLEGVSAHAAQPETGRSPAPAAAALIQALEAAPQRATALDEAAQATVVGVEVGGPAFGTSPGRGRVLATLRAHDDAVMERLSRHARITAEGLAAAHGLRCRVEWTEEFPAVRNHGPTVDAVARAAAGLGLDVERLAAPFAWSEDFGHVTALCPAAMIGLGAGEDQPPLHHPDYDFPDALLPIGARLHAAVAHALLEESP